MFRWPDENPARRPPWVALRQDLHLSLTAGEQRLPCAPPPLPLRRRWALWLRLRPWPTAVYLALGLGSVAWALHDSPEALIDPMASIGAIQGGSPPSASSAGTNTPATAEPAGQWGELLPRFRGQPITEHLGGEPPLPPATARRHAGSVVLASQYFGLTPGGNARAGLPSAATAPVMVAAAPPPPQPDSGRMPTPPRVATVMAPIPHIEALAADAAAAPEAQAASHPSLGDWLGVADALPLNGAEAVLPGQALSLSQAIEMGRLHQRQRLERRVGHRPTRSLAQGSATRSVAGTPPDDLLTDPGHATALAFLDALQTRLATALAQRHEHQINRVLAQARTAVARGASPELVQTERVVALTRQARSQTAGARAAQELAVKRLANLVGHTPQALAWGKDAALELPPDLGTALRSAHAYRPLAPREAGKPLSPPSHQDTELVAAYVRLNSFDRRLTQLRTQLTTHAHLARALHGQLLHGRTPVPEVLQAYGRLHHSRQALAHVALEDLQTQLQVAQSTGWLLRPAAYGRLQRFDPTHASAAPALDLALGR